MPISSVRVFSQQVLLGSFLSVSLAHAAGYTVQDLGPGGYVRDLNNRGDVLIAADSFTTTLWRNGAPETVTGLTHGLKLNSQGNILGDIQQGTGDPRYPARSIALRTADGNVITVTGISSIADPYTAAVALTDDNQVVANNIQPLLWSLQNPVGVPLHVTGIDRHLDVWGLNKNGAIIGSATQDANNAYGYKTVYLAGTTNAASADPGLVTVSGYLSFTPAAINDAGQVVGGKPVLNSKQEVTGQKSYIWTKATGEKPIPSLFLSSTTAVHDINNQGQVVGSAVPWVLFPSSNTTVPNTVGIVWSASKGTQNLNSLIGTASSKIKVTVAKFINDAGQIAAEGQVNGENHILLLTPKP